MRHEFPPSPLGFVDEGVRNLLFELLCEGHFGFIDPCLLRLLIRVLQLEQPLSKLALSIVQVDRRAHRPPPADRSYRRMVQGLPCHLTADVRGEEVFVVGLGIGQLLVQRFSLLVVEVLGDEVFVVLDEVLELAVADVFDAQAQKFLDAWHQPVLLVEPLLGLPK